MDNLLFAITLIVLIVLWFWLHHKSTVSSEKVHQKEEFIKTHPKVYHGISIHQCAKACANVKNLHGKRMLASEAVALPVFGCTVKKCTCSYVHHKDRRSGEDRRYASLVMEGVFSEHEHRTGRKDRRRQSFA